MTIVQINILIIKREEKRREEKRSYPETSSQLKKKKPYYFGGLEVRLTETVQLDLLKNHNEEMFSKKPLPQTVMAQGYDGFYGTYSRDAAAHST